MNQKTTITAKYLRRYPDSKEARSWRNAIVHIETEHGLWRPGACGYTTDPADAGQYRFLAARIMTAGLGPEKQVSYRRVDPAHLPKPTPSDPPMKTYYVDDLHNPRSR